MVKDGNNATPEKLLSNMGAYTTKDDESLDKRNKIYTDILDSYYNYLDRNLINNSKLRDTLINNMFTLLILSIVFTFVAIISIVSVKLNPAETIISLGTVLATEISSLALILSKISEYAFNKEETEQIGDIIKNIQDYDKAVREDRQNYRKNQEETTQN